PRELRRRGRRQGPEGRQRHHALVVAGPAPTTWHGPLRRAVVVSGAGCRPVSGARTRQTGPSAAGRLKLEGARAECRSDGRLPPPRSALEGPRHLAGGAEG